MVGTPPMRLFGFFLGCISHSVEKEKEQLATVVSVYSNPLPYQTIIALPIVFPILTRASPREDLLIAR